MKGKISKIKNTKGELALPVTTVEAVYLEDGKTKLSDEIKDVLKYEILDDEGITAEIPSVIEEIDGIKKNISEINSSLETTTKEVDKKADKEYVDLQDRDLLRQIGQGVTDEQLKNAVQSKIDDGSIASLSVGENSITPMNLKNGAKIVEPLIWTIKDDIIIKDLNTITIGSNVGVIYRGSFVYVTKGSYTFDGTDKYLVLRDVTLGEGGTVTPIIVLRKSLNDNDIILAYKSSQIWSIWDSIIADYVSNTNKNILAAPLPTSRRTPLGGFATITSRIPFNIDTENKTITFDDET